MTSVPRPGWIILAYYGVQFLIGVLVHVGSSKAAPGLLDLGSAGLFWLIITNLVFIWIPWGQQTWFALAVTLLVPVGIALAWRRLTGWTRLFAIVALLVGLNVCNLYLAMLAGA